MTAGPATADYIIEASALTKTFFGFDAVKDVDLKVRRHSIHALIGPNGAGKTTTFNLITKFLRPSSGTIRYNGEDITSLRPEQVARRGIVRSFQISAVLSAHDSARERPHRATTSPRQLLSLLAERKGP